MNLREEFNRMDHYAIDNNETFYDLRSLVEAVTLSLQDKKALQDKINKNDAKGASDYLQGLLSGKPEVTQSSVQALQTTQQNLQSVTEDIDDQITADKLATDLSNLVGLNLDWNDATADDAPDYTFNTIGDVLESGSAEEILGSLYSPDIAEKAKSVWDSAMDSLGTPQFKLAESEKLEEGRNDLKPVRCRSELSKSTYWSPYDSKEKKFAKFGIRYRYDTKEKCVDAINDASKDLGYKGGEDSMFESKNTVFKKLILEEDEVQTSREDIPPTPTITKSILSKVKSPEVLQMIKKPVKSSGQPWAQAWLLIKLYEAIYVEGLSSINRSELNRRAGTPDYDRQGVNSTYYNDFTRIGLARLSGNEVSAGPLLKAWIEGNASIEGNPHQYDLRKFLGVGDIPIRNTKGAGEPNYKKSHRGRRKDKNGGDPMSQTSNQNGTTTNQPGLIAATLDMFESFEQPEKADDDLARQREERKKQKTNRMIKQYKTFYNKDLDEEINYDDGEFRHFCNVKGWDYNSMKDHFKKGISVNEEE